MNEWISVEDKKPDEHETVLLWCKEEDQYFIGWAVHRHPMDVFAYFVFTHHDFDELSGEVSHWMPLPGPPK